jgi:hypothetical protein
MTEFMRLMAFGAATFCLGGAVAAAALFAFIARINRGDLGAGCMGGFLTIAGIVAAIFFFYLAVAYQV